MKAAAACALVFLAVAAVAPGKPLTVEKFGVTLDAPEGWNDAPEFAKGIRAPAELIACYTDPEGKRTFTALSTVLKANEIEGYTTGLLASLRRQGFDLGASVPVTIHDVGYESYIGTPAGASTPILQVFTTFGNGRAYTMSIASQVGDPTQDAELQAMVQSFAFQAPPQPFAKEAASQGPNREAIRKYSKLSLLISLLMCPAILVIGFLVLMRKKR